MERGNAGRVGKVQRLRLVRRMSGAWQAIGVRKYGPACCASPGRGGRVDRSAEGTLVCTLCMGMRAVGKNESVND